MPRHNLKGDLSVTVGRTTIGSSLATLSSQFLRGDETNLLSPIDASAVVNLSASYELHRRARLVGRVTNLFGREYETFGLLGEPDEVLGDEYGDGRFLSPGAPRAAWIGVELSIR